MAMINLQSEESVYTYGSDFTKQIRGILDVLENEYKRTRKVSRNNYNILICDKAYLSFLIRSAEKELKEEGYKISQYPLSASKTELFALKDKNFNLQMLQARINYLYHVYGEANSKAAFYASKIDFNSIIKSRIK